MTGPGPDLQGLGRDSLPCHCQAYSVKGESTIRAPAHSLVWQYLMASFALLRWHLHQAEDSGRG
jgi:hypothetical protein